MTEKKSAKSTSGQASNGFSADERAAMRERARELKAASSKADGERDLLAKISEMPESDRTLAERIHAIVKATAPDLVPRTWYGMPAYTRNGNVVCYFKAADKFKMRYAQFGFEEEATLDDGVMWPTVYAITKITATEEAHIAALVKKATS